MPSPSRPSTLRRTAFDWRLSANGTAAVAHRSPDGLRTICTVTLGPLKPKQIPVYAHGSLWMPRLFSGGIGIGPKTFLRSGARAALTRAAVLPQRRIDDSVVSASALP